MADKSDNTRHSPDQTLAALRDSISHWRNDVLAARTLAEMRAQISADKCALCRMFHRDDVPEDEDTQPCNGCPVRSHAGVPHCRGTPYMKIHTLLAAEIGEGQSTDAPSTELLQAVLGEIDLLEKLAQEHESWTVIRVSTHETHSAETAERLRTHMDTTLAVPLLTQLSPGLERLHRLQIRPVRGTLSAKYDVSRERGWDYQTKTAMQQTLTHLRRQMTRSDCAGMRVQDADLPICKLYKGPGGRNAGHRNLCQGCPVAEWSGRPNCEGSFRIRTVSDDSRDHSPLHPSATETLRRLTKTIRAFELAELGCQEDDVTHRQRIMPHRVEMLIALHSRHRDDIQRVCRFVAESLGGAFRTQIIEVAGRPVLDNLGDHMWPSEPDTAAKGETA